MKRYQERLLDSLPNLAVRPMPVELSVRLRVTASRECKRQASRRDLAARVRAFREWAQGFCREFVWPLALPFTGGVASAVVLFSMAWCRPIRCVRP